MAHIVIGSNKKYKVSGVTKNSELVSMMTKSILYQIIIQYNSLNRTLLNAYLMH